MNPLDEVMTPMEAAEALSLSRRHVNRLCETGKLTARRASGIWLILKSSVMSYTP